MSGREADVPAWLVWANLSVGCVAFAVDLWTLHGAWSIVAVPLGAPALTVGHLWALRILALMVHPRFSWADTNTKFDAGCGS